MGNVEGMFEAFLIATVVIVVAITSLAWWLLPKLWAWLMPIIHAATA